MILQQGKKLQEIMYLYREKKPVHVFMLGDREIIKRNIENSLHLWI